MTLRQLFGLVVGVSVVWCGYPRSASAGWITLTAGKAGIVDPTALSEFWYAIPQGELLTVEQVKNAGTIQATTGGGSTFFGSLATPVVLNLADGSATLTGGGPPDGVAIRGPNGDPAGALASAAPQSGVPVPVDSARLGLTFTDADGVRALSVTVSDGSGAVLGEGTLAVPEDGWWVLGLGPGRIPSPEPEPTPTPTPDPDPIPQPGPGPIPNPVPVPQNPPGVPEPGSMALGVSGLAALVLRARRRVRAACAGR